jgi:hypothetical protein
MFFAVEFAGLFPSQPVLGLGFRGKLRALAFGERNASKRAKLFYKPSSV